MFAGTTLTSKTGVVEVAIGPAEHTQPMPLYRDDDGQVWVAGTPGESYHLRVRNRTARRIEVIATVDGRHVLRDEAGSALRNRGLVFAANSADAFRGWRIDDAAVRDFVFGARDASVAAMATGSAANTGVIGFAVYRERQHYPVAMASAGGAGSFSADVTRGVAVADVATAGLGTGIGERREDHVSRTDFTRDHGTPDMLVIRYDTMEHLDRMGITGPQPPDAFPGDRETGYEQYAAR